MLVSRSLATGLPGRPRSRARRGNFAHGRSVRSATIGLRSGSTSARSARRSSPRRCSYELDPSRRLPWPAIRGALHPIRYGRGESHGLVQRGRWRRPSSLGSPLARGGDGGGWKAPGLGGGPAARGELMSRQILAPREDHGTRACYVSGCRCASCREANNIRYRARQARQAELAKTEPVKPNGPPLPGILRRGGRDYQVKRCPGANGLPCVRGAAWLRGQHLVCQACVERHTVWDGLVDAGHARAHLLWLRGMGVGYKSVAAVSDLASSKISEILSGRTSTIRASTERKILAITPEVARADGALVDAGPTNRLLGRMLKRGFRRRELAVLLGYAENTTGLQLGKLRQCRLSTKARVERFWKRVQRLEIFPKVWGDPELVRKLLARGVHPPLSPAALAEWRESMADLLCLERGE